MAQRKESARSSACRTCRRCEFDPWLGKIPGGGHGSPLQYSCLQNPMGRGAWRAQSMRSQRVRHNWSDLARGHTLTDMKVGLRWTGSKYAGWDEQEVSNCSLCPHSIYFLPCHHKMSELQRAVRYLSLYLLILQNGNTKTQKGKPFCLNDRVWIKVQHHRIPGLSSRPLPGVVHEPTRSNSSVWSWLEMHNLLLSPDILNDTLGVNKIPR